MRRRVRKCMITAVAVAVLIAVLPLSGCFHALGMYGNDRSKAAYFESIASDGGRIYSLSLLESGKSLFVSENGETSIIEREQEIDVFKLSFPAVVTGNDFPRYNFDCADGYDNLVEQIKERYEKDGVKHVQISAVEYEKDVAYGFCNLYSQSVGYLSGGGNIGAEKIVAGVYFTYKKADKTYTETEYLDGCNIVACNKRSLVYFKDKSYYAHTFGEEEKFICADEAFDTGFTNYSHTYFLYNADDCMIIMFKGDSDCKKEYGKAVLSTYDGEIKAICVAPCGGKAAIAE